MSKVGQVSWNEFNTRNVKAARAFYGAMFGWEFDTMPMEGGEYVIAKQGEEMIAGIFDMDTEPMLKGIPDHWFTYFEVADINASVKAAVDAGGSIKRPVFEVPGGMLCAIIVDATGGVFGLTQGG